MLKFVVLVVLVDEQQGSQNDEIRSNMQVIFLHFFPNDMKLRK